MVRNAKCKMRVFLVTELHVTQGRNKRQDPTRTCSNTWLSMNHSRVVETVYERIGDVLGVDKYKMSAASSTGAQVEGVASHMEVVHFGTDEHYSRHYDNSVTDEVFLHFITFQVILQTSPDFDGGDTNFPHAQPEGDWNVRSEQFSAVFWYNLLADGNLDETSMYGHRKVEHGEQWMFHVSIWDPTLPQHERERQHHLVYAGHDEL